LKKQSLNSVNTDLLLWLTDIDDEFVLEADSYRPQHTSASSLQPDHISSSFGRISSKPSPADRKENHLMTRISIILAAASAIAALYFGHTFFADSEQPVKEPATIEETTSDIIISADTVIPISPDERLLVATDDNLIIAVDSKGNVTTRLENAILASQDSHSFGSGAWVVSVDQPIPIKTSLTGLFSLKENDWIIEPQYKYLNILSDSLVTASQESPDSGHLMTIDGNIISSSDTMFERRENYISTHINSIETPFDLNGNRIPFYNERITSIRDDSILTWNYKQNTRTLYDRIGNTIWNEQSGLVFDSWVGDYLTWFDSNSTSIITDSDLNYVIDENVFRELNPDYNLSNLHMQIIAHDSESGELFISLINDLYQTSYCICDASFHILNMYSNDYFYREDSCRDGNYPTQSAAWSILSHPEYCYGDYYDSPSRIWHIEEDSQILQVSQLWSDESYTVNLPSDFSSIYNIQKAGALTLIQCFVANDTYHSALFINGELFTLDSSEQIYELSLLPWGVLALSPDVFPHTPDPSQTLYFSLNGTPLEPDSNNRLLLVSKDFQCVTDGQNLYIGGYDTPLYKLPAVNLSAVSEN